jgi:RNA polymerase sigma factor (sigma-70 family)
MGMVAMATIRLAPRERQVLALMCEDLSYKEIGRKLGISERTVESYAKRLLIVLDVRSKTGAVARALREGLVK